jgi:hypothetical protein
MYELPDYLNEHLQSLAHQYYDITNHAANEMFCTDLDNLPAEFVAEVGAAVNSKFTECLIKAFAE